MTPLLLAAMLSLAAAQAQPRVVGPLDPQLMRSGDLDAALAEFERLCLRTAFDRAAYEAAIARSSWRFRRASDAPEGASAFASVRGYAFFRDGGRLPQCNLDTAMRRAHDRDAVAGRIAARLEALLGAAPARREAGGSLFWQWPGEPGKAIRLYLMRHPGTDPRQLTLSLQKWPAELAGTAETPPEAQR